MPNYLYKCPYCDRKEEKSFSIENHPSAISCPCGETMVRQFTFSIASAANDSLENKVKSGIKQVREQLEQQREETKLNEVK
jgi:putative FmdB family regulatory protein